MQDPNTQPQPDAPPPDAPAPDAPAEPDVDGGEDAGQEYVREHDAEQQPDEPDAV